MADFDKSNNKVLKRSARCFLMRPGTKSNKMAKFRGVCRNRNGWFEAWVPAAFATAAPVGVKGTQQRRWLGAYSTELEAARARARYLAERQKIFPRIDSSYGLAETAEIDSEGKNTKRLRHMMREACEDSLVVACLAEEACRLLCAATEGDTGYQCKRDHAWAGLPDESPVGSKRARNTLNVPPGLKGQDIPEEQLRRIAAKLEPAGRGKAASSGLGKLFGAAVRSSKFSAAGLPDLDEDAPPQSSAFKNVLLDPRDPAGRWFFRIRRPNGEVVHFQTTVSEANGSAEHAARICRLCYDRVLKGWTKEEVTQFSEALFMQLRRELSGQQKVANLKNFTGSTKLPEPGEKLALANHEWNVIRDPGMAVAWLPPGWIQGIKTTVNSASRRCYVSPGGKLFYHKADVEKCLGLGQAHKAAVAAPLRPMQYLSSDAPVVKLQKTLGKSIKQEPEDAAGQFMLIREAAVGPTAELGTRIVKRLPEGTVVKVLEVRTLQQDKRIRGRLNDPEGWISLKNLETGRRWARKLSQWSFTPAKSWSLAEQARLDEDDARRRKWANTNRELPPEGVAPTTADGKPIKRWPVGVTAHPGPRKPWLPDDWAMGSRTTATQARRPVYIAPNGKNFWSRPKVEAYIRKMRDRPLGDDAASDVAEEEEPMQRYSPAKREHVSTRVTSKCKMEMPTSKMEVPTRASQIFREKPERPTPPLPDPKTGEDAFAESDHESQEDRELSLIHI